MVKNKGIKSLSKLFTSSKKTIYIIFTLYVGLGFYFGNWRTQKIIQWDVIVYYEYLTAAFVFNDLTFSFIDDLPDDFDGDIWLENGPDGERFPKTTIGVAIMLMPFYLIALFFNNILGMGSYGYSSFFQFFIFLAGIFYYLASLLLLRKVLLKYFVEKVVCITLIILSFATGLAYYALAEPGLSHNYSFFLFILLFWITTKWHEKASLKNSLALGATLGMIILMRPSNGLIVLIPLLYGIYNVKSYKERLKYIGQNFRSVIISILMCCVIISLQLFFWKYSTGKWLVLSYGEEGFFFNDPKIFEGLFGFRKGLLIYTPIMIFGFIGMFLSGDKLKELKWAAIVFTALNIYVILAWWCWWYGGGYGHRAFVESFFVFSFFIAVVVDRIRISKSVLLKVSSGILVVFFISLNLFQMRQYHKGFLHWDGMTYEAYKEIFFKDHTSSEFWDALEQPDYEEAKKGIR